MFVNIAFGADAVASTKQADQFGVLKKMKLVVPNISSFQAKQVGAALMQGVYGTFDFWWTLQDRYPLAKDFVQAFLAKNNYHPRWGAHIAYMQTLLWAVSVERAKTFYPPEVIKTLEASKSDPYETSLGKVYYRAEDHQTGASGARRGRQGPVGDEEPGRFLRRGGGGAGRASAAADRRRPAAISAPIPDAPEAVPPPCQACRCCCPRPSTAWPWGRCWRWSAAA